MAYAKGTTVPPDRSRVEIERTLERYGATGFMYGWDGDRAVIGFKAHEKLVRFELPMPSISDRDVAYTRTGQARARRAAEDALEAERRRRWRALALAIKAKLEAVESDIVSFEDEFLAHFVLPDGQTVGQRLAGDVEALSDSGLKLLGAGSES